MYDADVYKETGAYPTLGEWELQSRTSSLLTGMCMMVPR